MRQEDTDRVLAANRRNCPTTAASTSACRHHERSWAHWSPCIHQRGNVDEFVMGRAGHRRLVPGQHGPAQAGGSLENLTGRLNWAWVLAVRLPDSKRMGGCVGSRTPQLAMLSSLSTEDLIPADHPIRPDPPVVVDAVLAELG